MHVIRASIAILIVLAAFGTVAAQTGGIQIIVVDQAGQTLPGATVVLSNAQGFVKQTASVSDAKGSVLFPVLRAGPGYLVQVAMPGFAPQRHELRVKINETQTLRVQMLAEIQETVVVTADSDVVELDKSEVSTKFSDDFIQDLPVPGRFYQGVLTMAPGVQDDNGDGEVTVHGSRNRDFKAIVGGVSNVDPLTGQTMGLVNPNSIEEMEVITAGAGVEFGRAQGGFANIIQKQGSNEFEGLAEFIYRSSKLDGNGASGLRGDLVQEFNWYQPSVQFSGPIVRDKLWYRLSHEYIQREDPTNSGNAVFVTETTQGINSDQITWQVSPRNKLVFSYEWNPLEVNNAGVSSRVRPESAQSIDNKLQRFKVGWQAPFSPKIFFDSLVAYSDSSTSRGPTSPDSTNLCVSSPSFLAQTQCNDVQSGLLSGPFPLEANDSRQRFEVRTQATLYVGEFLGANHQVKMGFSVENERYFREQTRRPTLTSFLTFEEQDPDDPQSTFRESILVGRFFVPFQQDAKATGNIWSFYIQDQIKPLQNLTLTLGVAVDRENIESEGNSPFSPDVEFSDWESLSTALGCTGDDFNAECVDGLYQTYTGFGNRDDFEGNLKDQLGLPANTQLPTSGIGQVAGTLYNRRIENSFNVLNTNVSPRISLAWDPWSNGKTKFAATAGRYYNNLPLIIPMQEQNPASADLELICDGATCRLPTSGDVTPNITIVDRDLRTPYQDEWTVSFERELIAETLLRVTYINRKYRDQFQDVDINHVPGDFGSVCNNRLGGSSFIEGPPDGILDDCVGEIVVPRPGSGEDPEPPPELGEGVSAFLQVPDGIPDLYIQNPIWGDVYFVGNLNQADYEGISLELIRRQYRGWEMNGSYTYSEAVGNGEDFNQFVGDDQSTVQDEFGYQSNDRRHVVKLNATTITPWGFRFGTAVSWQSGLPFSILRSDPSRDAIPPANEIAFPVVRNRLRYPTGVRNDQRNTSYWNVDVKFTKEVRVGQRANLQLSAEVFNLFNDDTYIVYNNFAEIGYQINGVNDAFNRFGRQFQLGAKVTF